MSERDDLIEDIRKSNDLIDPLGIKSMGLKYRLANYAGVSLADMPLDDLREMAASYQS